MQIKRNIKYFMALILVFVLIFTSTNTSTGTNIRTKEVQEKTITAKKPEDETEQYKLWSSMPEEEKSKYIEPTVYPIKFDPAYMNQNDTGAYARIGATVIPKQHNVNRVVKIQPKHQGSTMECWAFSMTTVLEANIQIRTGKVAERFSERHIDYATSYTFADGTNSNGYKREVGTGGNFYIALGYSTNGTGLIKYEEMPFIDDESKINLSEINKTPVEKINDAKIFTTLSKYKDASGKTIVTNGAGLQFTDEQVQVVRNEIKKYILQNGPLAAYTYSNGLEYYNNQDIARATAYYCDSKSATPDHAITIVGWDDEYAVTNFSSNHRPSKPGAYIVLNSYGNQIMDNGYYYISYEDSLIESSVVGISDSEAINYDKIYQHDFYGYNYEYVINNEDTLYAANVFTRDTNVTKNVGATNQVKVEQLEEILVCVPATTNIEVYVNPTDDSLDINKMVKASIEETTLDETYNTIKLTTPIELKGEKFVIAVKYNVGVGNAAAGLELNYKTNGNISSMFDNVTSKRGESFVSADAENWKDLIEEYPDSNICIKGMSSIVTKTVETPNIPEDPPTGDPSGNQTNNTTNNTINNTVNNHTGNNTVNNVANNAVNNTVNNVVNNTVNNTTGNVKNNTQTNNTVNNNKPSGTGTNQSSSGNKTNGVIVNKNVITSRNQVKTDSTTSKSTLPFTGTPIFKMIIIIAIIMLLVSAYKTKEYDDIR